MEAIGRRDGSEIARHFYCGDRLTAHFALPVLTY